jgi:excisionase family DNA binding protein
MHANGITEEARSAAVRPSAVPQARTGRLLTAAEVADRIGTTERYVWSLGRRGILPRVVLPGGRLVRFEEADVDAMIEAGRSSEPSSPRRPTAKGRARRPAAQVSFRF